MAQSPSAFLLQQSLQGLLSLLPDVRDGNPDSVHQARVLTRRIREILPLYEQTHRVEAEELRVSLRKVGRCLGRVRELDVMQDTLIDFETRAPSAAGAVGAARAAVLRRQQSARRRMIKALERLQVDRL